MNTSPPSIGLGSLLALTACAGLIGAAQPAAAQSLGAGAPIASNPSPQIVGGEEAPAGRYPWMVLLLKSDVTDIQEAKWCGGSLIGPKHVLTAAHCIMGQSKFDVLVGAHDITKSGRRIKGVKITGHPEYSDRTENNDVAVLELAEAVTDIKPVHFISNVKQETRAAPTGQMMTVIGWGDIRWNGPDPDQLRQVDVPIVDRAACNKEPMYPGMIGKAEICAGYPEGGKDACQGDSGGPLIRRGDSPDKDVQVGVVSWGDVCAAKNRPGVYARLATLGKWVREQMKPPAPAR